MKKIASVLVLSTAISAPAFAANQGGFIAADLGSASFSNAGVPGQTVGAYPNPGSFYIGGGFRFTPNVGVEAGYSMIGDSTVNYSNASTTMQTSALQIAAVGTVPLSDKFDVFGKLGMASISSKVSGTGVLTGMTANTSTTNMTFAIGAQFNVSQQAAIRVQYQDFGKAKFTATQGVFAAAPSDIGVSVISVGGVFSF